jgi:hypothetical protein
VARHPDDTSFAGTCPFHGACIEGLISAGAIAARCGVAMADLQKIPDDHPVWNFTAYYLAQVCPSYPYAACFVHIFPVFLCHVIFIGLVVYHNTVGD